MNGDMRPPQDSGITEADRDVVSDEQTRIRTRLLIGAYAAAVGAYGYGSWWKNRTNSFKVEQEGWFEEDSYRGGADKVAHAYATYTSTRLLSRALVRLGNDERHARRVAALSVGYTAVAVEILDGFTDKFGFSYEDIVMDAAGIGLGLLLDADPQLDARFDFRIMYWPSSAARRLGEKNPLEDYSGQTYLFITKASGFAALRRHAALRYLELAVGYGSRGYKPTDGTQTLERKLYVGISLNLSQLLEDSVFRDSRESTAHIITRGTLEYVQIPGTVALKAAPL